eukprot:gene26917-32527_t
MKAASILRALRSSFETVWTVLKGVKSWSQQLVDGTTSNPEALLTGIIKAMKEFAGGPGMEVAVAALQDQLVKEVQLRERQEKEVLRLQSDVQVLQAKERDKVILNSLIGAMGVFKQFIMRVEIKIGSYTAQFQKATDRDVIDSLFPEPLDPLLDTSDEQDSKVLLASLSGEAKGLFSKLGVDCKLVFDLNHRIQHRNLSEHPTDNKRYKDAPYISNQLANYKKDVEALDEMSSELGARKMEIGALLEQFAVLHSSTMKVMSKVL